MLLIQHLKNYRYNQIYLRNIVSSHKSRTLNLYTKFWLKKCVNYASKCGTSLLTCTTHIKCPTDPTFSEDRSLFWKILVKERPTLGYEMQPFRRKGIQSERSALLCNSSCIDFQATANATLYWSQRSNLLVPSRWDPFGLFSLPLAANVDLDRSSCWFIDFGTKNMRVVKQGNSERDSHFTSRNLKRKRQLHPCFRSNRSCHFMFFFCTVHCDIIIQQKIMKCTKLCMSLVCAL